MEGCYLKILILLLCQRLFGNHEDSQTFPRHVPTLENTDNICMWSKSLWFTINRNKISVIRYVAWLVGNIETYLLLQPVVILDDAWHHHIGTFHVESDLSCWFILEKHWFVLYHVQTVHKIVFNIWYNDYPAVLLAGGFLLSVHKPKCTCAILLFSVA